MERGKILDEAKHIINKDRQDAYGNPEDCFGLIARLWNVYLDFEGIENKITPAQVAMMMALLKIARERMNHKQDNLIDACGYLALCSDLTKEVNNE